MIPLNTLVYKILAGILILATLSTSFYYKGLNEGRKELADYKIAVKAVGDAQEAKTKQVILSQQQITNEANDEITKLRAALTNYFDDPRVHVDYSSGQRKLPSISETSKRVNEPTAESPLDTCIAKARDDALTILMWQQWANRIFELGR